MGLFNGLGNALFGVPPVSSQPYQNQANQLQQGAQQYAGQEQSAYNSQQQLADSLWNTINGRGPSVADIRLQQALGQGLAQNTAMGAGATGQNAVLARYLAATANGNQAAQAAQSAALLKAQETQNAQSQYGNVATNMANEGGNMYGSSLSNALGYSNLSNNINQGNAQRSTLLGETGLGAAGGAVSGLGSFLGSSPKSMGNGVSSGSGGGSGGLGSSDSATSNAAWDAYGS